MKPETTSPSEGRAPLVTIGLPIYNNERHVAQSISSLLAQTYRDFVLVISDNASTDGTSAICERFAQEDSRVRYYRNPVNIGLTPNFNRVFDFCETKYFKWATGDDFSAPETLERAVAVLEAEPSVVLWYPKIVLVDGEGREKGRYEDVLPKFQATPAERFVAVIEHAKLVNHHLGLLRADVIRKTHLFGKYVGADIGFIAEMSLYGKFHQADEHLFYRRFHADSSSWNRGDKEQEARRFHAANARRVPFGIWLSHYAFLRAVWCSPLSASMKAKLLAQLAKGMYWDSKWLANDLTRDVPTLLRFDRGKSVTKK